MNYYNEFDPKAATWLRNLIAAKLIPAGDVDERSICDVSADDVRGYDQCHFFAGIGGWCYALQLAGWPEDRPVWTGSCPCQPYSAAGKQKGDADERNLWPQFHRLIRECRPECCFGEQVANAIGHGWLDGISTDLEAEGYAVGSVVLGAHSVGAPIMRQRLYWVACASIERQGADELLSQDGFGGGKREPGRGGCEDACRLECADGTCGGKLEPTGKQSRIDSDAGIDSRVGGTESTRPQGQRRERGEAISGQHGRLAGLPGSPWDRFQLVYCTDGALRRVPVEPAFFPLADGVPARVVRLRGYGNAIVPQVAAEFIGAFLGVEEANHA